MPQDLNISSSHPLLMLLTNDQEDSSVVVNPLKQLGYRVMQHPYQPVGTPLPLPHPCVILFEVTSVFDRTTQESLQAWIESAESIPVIVLGDRLDSASVEYILSLGVADYWERSLPEGVLHHRLNHWQAFTVAQREVQPLLRAYTLATSRIATLERMIQEKDEYLNVVTHELRSPLGNIKLAIDVLEKGLLPDDRERSVQGGEWSTWDYLQLLRHECDRNLQLINDFLDLQRLELNRQTFTPDAIDLQSFVEFVVHSFQQRLLSRNQTLTLHMTDHLPWVDLDPTSFERILSELIGNACKYSPPGAAIDLFLALTPQTLQLTIVNSGVEIPVEEQARIFEKFYRIPNSDRWQQGGSGLGLALIHALIQQMHGRIWVESQTSQTRFIVELPLETSNPTIT